MRLTFADYQIRSNGIDLRFTVSAPQPGQPTEYTVRLTDAEITNATTNEALRIAVTTKLARQIYAASIAARLDPLLGVEITV
jgi:hypothetical protein